MREGGRSIFILKMSVVFETPILLSDVNDFFGFVYDVIFKPHGFPRDAPYGNRDMLKTAKKQIMRDKATRRILATGGFYLETPEEAYISYIAVADTERKKGYGRLMMEVLEYLALRKGASSAYLWAMSDAVKFYEKLGYKLQQSRVFSVDQSKVLVYRMQKALLPSPKL